MLWSILIGLVYVLLAVYDSIQAEKQAGNRQWKPFLMPVLAVFYSVSVFTLNGGREYNVFLVLGLLCGCAGDTLLEMGTKKFPLGLLGFMLNHLFFILAFFSSITPVWIWPLPWWMIVLIVAYVGYFVLMLPRMMKHMKGALKPACLVYLSLIYLMSLTAFYRFSLIGATNPFSVLSMIGSWLFVASDSILFFRMFAGGKDHGVMQTYTAAQALIVLGVLLA